MFLKYKFGEKRKIWNYLRSQTKGLWIWNIFLYGTVYKSDFSTLFKMFWTMNLQIDKKVH